MKRLLSAAVCLIAAMASAWAQTSPATADLASLIESGDRKAALKQILAGADVNKAQADGTTPLHWAVIRVDYELAQELIKHGAKPSATNVFGSAPLAEAAKFNDTRMAKILLDAGANVEGANEDHQTALMLAVKASNVDMVRMLLDKGANASNVETFHNQTPLMWAAASDRNAAAMVDLLLAKGANPKPRSLYTDWPAQISSEPRGQFRPVGGLTALLYAARNGCNECVASLIKAGADLNDPTPEGVTPLMIAIDNGHNDAAKLLLDSGANPSLWDWWGRTALFIAVDRKPGAGGGRGGRGGAAAGGPAPLAPSTDRGAGRPAVSSMELIAMILDKGADPNSEMNFRPPSRGGNSGRFGNHEQGTGCTPLYRAIEKNDREVIDALLAHGANPNIAAVGVSPFLLAAGVGGRGGAANRALVESLVQHGADVNAKVTGSENYTGRVSRTPPASSEGLSALHAAVERGDADMVRFLLEHGADPNLLDAQGRRPIDVIGAAGAGAAKGKGGPGAPGGGGGAGKGKGQPPAAGGGAGAAKGKGPLSAAGGRGGAAGSPEIRALLEAAMAKN